MQFLGCYRPYRLHRSSTRTGASPEEAHRPAHAATRRGSVPCTAMAGRSLAFTTVAEGGAPCTLGKMRPAETRLTAVLPSSASSRPCRPLHFTSPPRVRCSSGFTAAVAAPQCCEADPCRGRSASARSCATATAVWPRASAAVRPRSQARSPPAPRSASAHSHALGEVGRPCPLDLEERVDPHL